MSLDLEPGEFRNLLHDTVDRVADFYEGLSDAPLFHDKSPAEVESLFDQTLPRCGTHARELLADATKNLLSATSLNASPAICHDILHFSVRSIGASGLAYVSNPEHWLDSPVSTNGGVVSPVVPPENARPQKCGFGPRNDDHSTRAA